VWHYADPDLTQWIVLDWRIFYGFDLVEFDNWLEDSTKNNREWHRLLGWRELAIDAHRRRDTVASEGWVRYFSTMLRLAQLYPKAAAKIRQEQHAAEIRAAKAGQRKAGDGLKYTAAERAAWLAAFVERRSHWLKTSGGANYSSAAEHIRKSFGLGPEATQTVRKHIGKHDPMKKAGKGS